MYRRSLARGSTTLLLMTVVLTSLLQIGGWPREAVAQANPSPLAPYWKAGGSGSTGGVAWGDVDDDGDLDLAIGNRGQPNWLFLNTGGVFERFPDWTSIESDVTTSLAWGDVDGDGDLDLATGNAHYDDTSQKYDQPIRLYRNTGGALERTAAWSSAESANTTSIAWGDVDLDGDLDLAVGNDHYDDTDKKYDQPIRLYRNVSGTLSLDLGWNPEGANTQSVAWGDVDGDGDLDLAVGNRGSPNQLYRNIGGNLESTAIWSSASIGLTNSVDWGDIDGDGDLDLAVGRIGGSAAYANEGGTAIYLNHDGTLEQTASWSSAAHEVSFSIDLGDVDGDGDLDIVAGMSGYARVYLNNGGTLEQNDAWSLKLSDTVFEIAWADLDNDGDLDLAFGLPGFPSEVYRNADAGPAMSLAWSSSDGISTSSPAWGDVDGDGDLDLATGGDRIRLHRNAGGELERDAAWSSTEGDDASSLAWGDVDGDGDLDLAAGGGNRPTRVYRNTDAWLEPTAAWSSTESDSTTSLAWGDVDGDGDLDLATGGWNRPTRLYRNTDKWLERDAAWSSTESDKTTSLAWGDVDGDGDLDLAAGSKEQPARIYRNTGDTLELTALWTISERGRPASSAETTGLAWGDVDGDSDLDLAVANTSSPNRLYRNVGGVLEQDSFWAWTPALSRSHITESAVAWGDVDSDGDLDLTFTTNSTFTQENTTRIFSTVNGAPEPKASWSLTEPYVGAKSIAWGDFDGDGDADLAIGNGRAVRVYRSGSGRPAGRPTVTIGQPGTAAADLFSASRFLSAPSIPISYLLSDPAGRPVRSIRAFYSLDGGGSWRPAAAAPGTRVSSLATRSRGLGCDRRGCRYRFVWDLGAGGDPARAFSGQSDSVIFRIEALPQSEASYQWARVSATTFPFRVRGTTARVVSEARPSGQPDAQVYRLPAGQIRGAEPLTHRFTRRPMLSAPTGYVGSRDPILIGDRLVAVLPTSRTGKLTYAYTSADPDATGLNMPPITAETLGVQTLTVTPRRPLLLLNLDVGLEWDARGDTAYLDALKARLRRASEILYDWSDGQIALGDLTLYHNRERWEHTLDPQGAVIARGVDLRIYASNAIRPNATQGGIVDAPTTVAYPNAPGEARSATYEPGYIRIGAGWASAGEPGADSAEDWARALAHELGHYAFFLDETYLGRAGDLLVPVEGCPSPMADPYAENASEYRPQDDWPEACRTTLQYLGTGLAEWELIKQRYDRSAERDGFSFTLSAPTRAGANPGPSALPMAVTTFADGTQAPPVAVSSRAYGVIPPDRGRYTAAPGARAILFRASGQLVDLGTPVGGQVQVHGLASADRLCVLDPEQELLGCELTPTGLTLVAKPGWRPELQVTPLTRPGPTGTATMTLRVEVPATTVATATLPSALRLRLHPRESTLAPVNATLPLVEGVYRAEIALPEVVEEGLLQLWVDEPGQRREAVVDYSLGGNPAPKKKPPRRSRRNAPAVSPDGQATLFSEETSFGPGQFFALQSTSNLPAPPPWATVVGQGYRLMASDPAMLARPDRPLALSLGYAEGSVPPGLEGDVRVIFHDGSAWRELPTRVNRQRNEAAVTVQPEPGLYVLVTSLRLRFERAGWSLIYAYPGASQPLPAALAGAPGGLTMVYGFDAADAVDPWKLFAPGLSAQWAPVINDLAELREGQSYWIHASGAITVPVRTTDEGAPATSAAQGPASLAGGSVLSAPPATLYGIVPGTPADADLTIEARIGEVVCGTTTTAAHTINGQPQAAFSLNVLAAGTGSEGCGAPGATITLRFLAEGASVLTTTLTWRNTSLTPVFGRSFLSDHVFLPQVSLRVPGGGGE